MAGFGAIKERKVCSLQFTVIVALVDRLMVALLAISSSTSRILGPQIGPPNQEHTHVHDAMKLAVVELLLLAKTSWIDPLA